MKILVAHNYYQWPGGEDIVFEAEKALLAERGHEVIEYVRHNQDIASSGLWDHTTLAARAVWNWDSYAEVKQLLVQHRPDVAHFHNIFPLISPAAFNACWEAGVPIVQSLHNARLICPAGVMYYDGGFCQDCLGKTFPWPGVVRGCYRKSHIQTGIVGLITTVQRSRQTWAQMVSRYIVFTDFYLKKFLQAGFPASKLVIKPHFVKDLGIRREHSGYVLFVGRLSEDKGVSTVMNAWRNLPQIPLKMCGEGPLKAVAHDFAKARPGMVEVLSFMPRDRVADLMKGAAFLLWPSQFSETFGLVAVEAFSCGVPVIASDVGAMPAMVSDGRTGLTFRAGDASDLAAKVTWAWENLDRVAEMGRAARSEYESKYTIDSNYNLMMEIYRDAIAQREADEIQHPSR